MQPSDATSVDRFTDQINPTVVATLSEITVLHVAGTDAAAFLQSQFCNDVAALPDNGVQLNGYCTPKGRLLAVFHLIRRGDGFMMLVPESVAPAFRKRLSMFVLRADVTIDRWTIGAPIAILGGGAADASAGELPDVPGQGCVHGESWVGRLPGPTPSWIALGEAGSLDSVRAALPPDTPTATDALWRASRLLAGEPILAGDAVDRFVPQMLNLDLIDGLSFRKGCYPGQEIVARTRYLGKQKRRMLLYHVDAVPTDAPVGPGSAIKSESKSGVGEVLAAERSGDGLLLAVVLRLEHLRSQLSLDIEGPDCPLAPVALPYDALEGTDFVNA